MRRAAPVSSVVVRLPDKSAHRAPASHAVATAHMADHELGAAAYAIKAVMFASLEDHKEENRRKELEWQIEQLPMEIKELVISDQKNRNEKFWSLFY